MPHYKEHIAKNIYMWWENYVPQAQHLSELNTIHTTVWRTISASPWWWLSLISTELKLRCVIHILNVVLYILMSICLYKNQLFVLCVWNDCSIKPTRTSNYYYITTPCWDIYISFIILIVGKPKILRNQRATTPSVLLFLQKQKGQTSHNNYRLLSACSEHRRSNILLPFFPI